MKQPRYVLRAADAFKANLRGKSSELTPGEVFAVRKDVFGAVESDKNGTLVFTLSTATPDRSADTVNQHGWHLDNYAKNGVVLWAHDQSAPPVAKSARPVVEDGRLLSRGVEFTPRDLYPFGDMVGRMYKGGFLNAVSVGFLPRKWVWNEERGQMAMDFQEQELLEFSAVPVPANPEALVGAKSAGIELAPMVEWAEKILDGEGSSLVIPREYVEAIHKHAKPSRVVSVGKAPAADEPDESEQDEDDFEEDKLAQALAALTAAVQENTAEVKALRQDMTAKAAKPVVVAASTTSTGAPAQPSNDEIAKRVATEVKQTLTASTGRIE